ncbi:MAG TPA: lysophospholipid acyltransferase family protein [Acidimicrobiales bacterium]|nr:lysophospholipid acyltransferase family protein [Acidimicrobiales bacterium]
MSDPKAAAPPTWPFRRSVRVTGGALRDLVLTRIVKHWVDLCVEGTENLDGLASSALFIFNHGDDFDVPVLYAALPAKIRNRLSVATGSNIIDEHPILAFVIRFFYAGFSFARQPPYRPSLRYVGELVASGRHILLAPEGQLSETGELGEFKDGIGLLAVKLGVPVVPMKITGLYGTVPMHAAWPKRHANATVHIGAPLHFGRDEKYRDVTLALRKAVQSL